MLIGSFSMIVKSSRTLVWSSTCEAADNDDDDDTKTHVVVMPAAAVGRTIENIGWIIILVISSRPVTGF